MEKVQTHTHTNKNDSKKKKQVYYNLSLTNADFLGALLYNISVLLKVSFQTNTVLEGNR